MRGDETAAGPRTLDRVDALTHAHSVLHCRVKFPGLTPLRSLLYHGNI